MKKTILIIEDEERIATVLKKYLEGAGYATEIMHDGDKVLPVVKRLDPALILLDLMLPGKDGMEICKEIRVFSNVPIIILTARSDEIERVLGLEIGADDYVCKPFSPREVVARVKSNLRRNDMITAGPLEASGALSLNHANCSATLDGVEIIFTPIEFRILVALQKHPDKILSRDQLLNHMYNDHRTVSDRTVDSHVANLRRKLQNIRHDDECITSKYGVGYRLEL